MAKDLFKVELEIQKNIAYTAGLLQGDVTIKTLIESLAEGVVITNDSGRIILINKKMSELTGYTKQEVMGQELNIFIPEPIHEKHNSKVKDFFINPRIRPMGIGLDLEARRKDQSSFPVEISLSYLDTESGRLAIAFLTDITTRMKAVTDLKERNVDLDSYAHTVAHDLNSSVANIVSLTDILLDNPAKFTHQNQTEFLQDIAANGRNMLKIIRELLIFASLKKEDIDVSFVNMEEIFQSAIARLKFQIKESNALIRKPDTLINCRGYSPWIEEIWLNFISNAIKYGSSSPIVEISSARMSDGFIKYSIKDFGRGIPEDYKKVIFESSTVNRSQEIKGYGLGLSIVKRIIDKFDGYLSVESELGKGSTFNFYLKE